MATAARRATGAAAARRAGVAPISARGAVGSVHIAGTPGTAVTGSPGAPAGTTFATRTVGALANPEKQLPAHPGVAAVTAGPA